MGRKCLSAFSGFPTPTYAPVRIQQKFPVVPRLTVARVVPAPETAAMPNPAESPEPDKGEPLLDENHRSPRHRHRLVRSRLTPPTPRVEPLPPRGRAGVSRPRVRFRENFLHPRPRCRSEQTYTPNTVPRRNTAAVTRTMQITRDITMACSYLDHNNINNNQRRRIYTARRKTK